MNSSASFKVYNASAGSGKTFALVKSYLKEVLAHPQNGYYKHLLAITFTNKAVAEMKERIVATLSALSKDPVPSEFRAMLSLLQEETSLTESQIRKRSEPILKHLLHHYAQFSIETIDSFNHRLIRTFAHDLKLASNFEVSLDTDEILSKAVDQFIEKAGTDPEITQLLLEFALQKTDEDKSWDISFDLKKTASLLASENDRWNLQCLKGKSISDFRSLQKQLQKNTKELEKEIAQEARALLEKLSENGIPWDVFQRGTFPNHFKKLQERDYDIYKNKLEEYLEVGGNKLYKSQTAEGIKQQIDVLVPYFLETYKACKAKVHQIKLYHNILKNLVPLAAINGVNLEIAKIKEEDNILPISEFNALIFSEIKDQPAPFIYERLGDRYRHFFIDEFQDTSKLQWKNLVPLIDNALSQTNFNDETGSLLLVGDAKQSIYRWRGGLPEQFMELSKNENPFTAAQKQLIQLDTNYRSAQQIIDFNNQFFSFVASYLGNDSHRMMYETGNKQKHTKKTGGYVKIEFINAQNKQEEHELYPEKVHQTLRTLLDKGIHANDICILTRRKKDGVVISQYLLEKDPSIPIISEETLLLSSSILVTHLVHLLSFSVDPLNEEAKILVLEFLHEQLNIVQEKHDFFCTYLKAPLSALSQKLKELNVLFNFEVANKLSLYESLEYCIDTLNLADKADVFVTNFMDLAFRFSQRPGMGKVEFLDYWGIEKDKASISSNNESDAVRLMTIHKSKGLEFPVIIFPYADVNLYAEIEPKSWYPWNENGFDHLLIDYKKELEDYSETGAMMVKQRTETLELDNINLFYVALTRAETQLYVFAKNEPLKDTFRSYNTFLIGYLSSLGLWEEGKSNYEFGMQEDSLSQKSKETVFSNTLPYTVSSPESHHLNIVTSSLVGSEEQAEAIGLGNRFHDSMAKIETTEDLDTVLNELDANLSEDRKSILELKKFITDVVKHPDLKELYKAPYKVYNEREIATPQKMIRPDRVVVHSDGTATIIDYKTGASNPKYVEQIYEYSDAIEAMGYSVREKLLVYCNTNGILINKS